MTSDRFIFKKSLGQNFLHNQKTAQKIAFLSGDLSDKVVIEIGCGNGFLTREILNLNPKKLVIIELDQRCIDLASENLKNLSNFNVLEFIQMDALDLKVSKISTQKPVIISNLPYSVGSRIFVNLTQQSGDIEKMVLMFQKEVGERLVADVNTENYGLLSVICQLFWSAELNFHVSPGDFTPKPAVISSVLTFDPLKNNLLFEKILPILKQIFSNRRKMLRSYCKDIITKFPEYSEKRSGELHLAELVRISEY